MENKEEQEGSSIGSQIMQESQLNDESQSFIK
jgi:hypothetical protein